MRGAAPAIRRNPSTIQHFGLASLDPGHNGRGVLQFFEDELSVRSEIIGILCG